MRKLDRGIAARIFEELDEIAKLEDPRVRGKSLTRSEEHTSELQSR